jgi:hypothetical protein
LEFHVACFTFPLSSSFSFSFSFFFFSLFFGGGEGKRGRNLHGIISNVFTAMSYDLIPFLSLNYLFTAYIHTASSHLPLPFLPPEPRSPTIVSELYPATIVYSQHQHSLIHHINLHPPPNGFHIVLRGPPGHSLRLRRRNGKHQGYFRRGTHGRHVSTNPRH